MTEDRKKSRVRFVLAVAAILAVALAARAAVFTGFAASDDANYAELANQVACGEFPPAVEGVPGHYPGRLGVIVPVAVIFRVLGVSEATLVLFPMLASLGMMALAFWAGRTFFSTRAGLLAAAVFAVMPIECRFATWLLSDTAGAFWAAAGMLALWQGRKAQAAGRKVGWGVGAGGCFGLSWLTRAQVAHLAPLVLVLLVVWTARDRRNLRLGLAVAAVSLVIFLGECVLYWGTRGDFLARFSALEQMCEGHKQWYFTEGTMYGWPEGRYGWGLMRRWFRQGPCALLFKHNFAWVQLVALVAAAYAAKRRLGAFALPVVWFVWACVMFNFGSTSLRHYQPLPWIDSYLMPTLFPAALIVGGWLDFMLARPEPGEGLGAERRFWAGAAIVTLLVGAAFGNLQHVRQGIGCPVARRAAEAVNCRELVYTDPVTLRALRFFWGYPEKLSACDFSYRKLSDLPSGARVLVNPHQLERQKDIIGYEPPAWVTSPPKHWRKVREFRGRGVLYATGKPKADGDEQ